MRDWLLATPSKILACGALVQSADVCNVIAQKVWAGATPPSFQKRVDTPDGGPAFLSTTLRARAG